VQIGTDRYTASGLAPDTDTAEGNNVMKIMAACAALIATASISQAQVGEAMGRGRRYRILPVIGSMRIC
jgi:hypothetical protein